MTVLLQISDPHFGTERPAVVEALLHLAHEVRPAIAVISGDITQRARRAQFAAARDFVARLTTSALVAIPGNHDIPLFNVLARAFYPYRGFQWAFGEQLEPEWDNPAFRVLCVNTTRPSRHKDGEVSAEQVDRISQRLQAAAPEQVRVVVTHQPVYVLKGSEVHNRVHGYERAISSWSAAGADIIMGGHIHLPYIAPLHEHSSGVKRRCWVVQAGTAVSHRVRRHQANSVNIIKRTKQLGCVIERWDYSTSDDRFSCAMTQELPLERP